MQEILIAVLVGILFYILGLFTDEVRNFVDRVRDRFGSQPIGLSGFFHTDWDKGANRPQRELLELRERRGRITGNVVYAVDSSTSYTVKGNLLLDGQVLLTWKNVKKSISGTIQSAKKGGGAYEGKWTGPSPTASQAVRADTWKMSRLRLHELPVPDLSVTSTLHKAALAELITAHETRITQAPEYWTSDLEFLDGNRLELMIQRGIFDPSLGRGSKRLLEYASRLTSPGDVLDLGFGSGIFGIYFAKFKGSRVIGTDTNEAAVYCASANAGRNAVSDSCDFLHGDLYAPVYNAYRLDRQFDLIIANLPFSRAHLVRAAISTANVPKDHVPWYREMFASSDAMLRKVLYGATFFLRRNGVLLLLTGGSADLRILRASSRLSGLTLARGAGDIFAGKSEELMVVALQKP